MEKSACGIISYAGLNREVLLAKAKAMFAQAQPPVAGRFDAFLPIFPLELVQNMDYAGPTDARGAHVAANGFSIDPVEYHRKLYAQLPELYAEDNYKRNFDYEGRYVGRSVFTVDRAWVDHFPQYQPFMGEKLYIYLIGGGAQAVAVPESVYPRGGGVLEAAEEKLQVTQRAGLYVQYARTRIAAGDRYEADAFSAGFLTATKQQPFMLTQKELSRILQDLSIVKSLQSEASGVGLYTDNARMAERVNQYVPMRYACDLFSPEAVDKHTARLMQLCSADGDFISDLWIPYQDIGPYVNKQALTLDVRALCAAYQIAPRYDPETGGGRYPDAVRVVVVRDRELKLLVGEALNNPAYGDGMSPQGTIGRQVYIADSREMIRQRKLAVEEIGLTPVNLTLPPDAYRRCAAQGVLQEHKGRLVDAMYRRETVLRQIDAETPVYVKACQLLTERVDKLAEIVKKESAQSRMSQMSGYDADIDYLRRMQMDREGEPEKTPGKKPIPFARDPQREQSIECGYAMRAGIVRMMYADAALPDPPPGHILGADDSDEEPLLQPAPSGPNRQSAGETATRGAGAGAPAAAIVPGSGKPTRPNTAEPLTSVPGEGSLKPDAAPRQAGEQALPTVPAPAGQRLGAAHDTADSDAERDAGRDSSAGTGSLADSAPVAGMEYATDPEHTAGPERVAEDATAPEAELAEGQERIADDGVTPEAELQPDADRSSEPEHAADAAYAPEDPTAADGETEPGADDEGAQTATPEQPDGQTTQHKRVSLRELSDRLATDTPAENETPPPESTPEEPPKPKLAYILRRGSETTASKSYRRMAEMLDKRKP